MPGTHRPLRYGLIVGLIAFSAVAVIYALFDAVAGRAFLSTVNQLGHALLARLGDTAGLDPNGPIEAAAVLVYSVFHLVAAFGVGVLVTTLVERAHRRPDRAPITLLVIISGFVVTIGAAGAFTIGIRHVLPWWSIIAANVVAVVLAGLYLMRCYPTAFERLTDHPSR